MTIFITVGILVVLDQELIVLYRWTIKDMPRKNQRAETVEGTSKAMRGMCTPARIQKAKDMLAMGETATNICKELGIHRRSYYWWRAKNPEFHQAILDGVEIFWAIMGIKLVQLAQKGMCQVELAAEFGVGLYTFREWISNESKLKLYWDIAYTRSFAYWWQRVRKMLDDPKTNKGAVNLLIWTMKIRFRLFDNILMSELEDVLGIKSDDKVVHEAEIRLKTKWLAEAKHKGQDNASIIDVGEEGGREGPLLVDSG